MITMILFFLESESNGKIVDLKKAADKRNVKEKKDEELAKKHRAGHKKAS